MKTLQSRNIEAAKRFSAVKKAVEQLYPEDLPETPPAPVQTRLFETINGIVRGKTLGDIMTLAPGIGDAGLRSCAVLVKDKNNNTEARYGGKSLREVLSKESDLRYSVVKSYSERSDTQVWYVEFH